MSKDKEDKSSQLFKDILNESGLDAQEIINALHNSVELGFVDWGEYRQDIVKLLHDPEPKDLHALITKAETILRPLEEWMMMERKINALRKNSVSKYEYYITEYQCSQIQNFILLLKLT